MSGSTGGAAVVGRVRSVTRLEIETGQDYETFRTRYEQAVPPLDYEQTFALVEERAGWDRVLELADQNGPLGFMIYWRFDAQPMMGLAGSTARCTEYLMGNHTIAERMFRHDAGALANVPLRTTVHEAPDGRVLFAIDRPSELLQVFGQDAISEVGRELDRKVGALLEHLDVPVPEHLR